MSHEALVLNMRPHPTTYTRGESDTAASFKQNGRGSLIFDSLARSPDYSTIASDTTEVEWAQFSRIRRGQGLYL